MVGGNAESWACRGAKLVREEGGERLEWRPAAAKGLAWVGVGVGVKGEGEGEGRAAPGR